MAYPDSPQVVVGTRTLLVALVELGQSTQAGCLPAVSAGQPFWARSNQAAELVAAGLAAYAPAGTQLRPEPPYTVSEVPGFARGTSNRLALSWAGPSKSAQRRAGHPPATNVP